ncbi:hypothetical protein GCM10010174_76090 [Kutzneria viridogrisea]|uniref:Uncharacterized protein n=1 Tax=Kutzneria viridogrisea TaxID=47990 RepID=A0ABR6BNY0_9PSEU|nr:hypothetical protein [Kutzneria viridogrisea]
MTQNAQARLIAKLVYLSCQRFLFWFLALAAAVAVLVGVLATVSAALNHSIWEKIAVGAALYFPLALAIMTVPVQLRVYVANDSTRRAFTLGAIGGLVLTAPPGRSRWCCWKPRCCCWDTSAAAC